MSYPGAGAWRRLVGRLDRIDRERFATAVIVAGVTVAAVTALLAGFLPAGNAFAGLLYPLAVLLPLFGVALAALAIWSVWGGARSADPPLFEGEPPEIGHTRTESRIGHDAERLLGSGAAEWYRCSADDATEALSERLVEAAIRTLSVRRGLDRAAAREAVRSGTWTDDPVAAAFLAADRRQPSGERLRAAIDPGAAYGRRLRRTLDAIAAIDGRSSPAATDNAGAIRNEGEDPDQSAADAEPEVRA
ncbi:hypothetical protein OB905_01210 [Halobacteria archaeon AArc-dxtr1]|nr:hypothetical protein [Halobacteria archaeon AArc-dxtr1]